MNGTLGLDILMFLILLFSRNNSALNFILAKIKLLSVEDILSK